jgi:hypothetical protein
MVASRYTRFHDSLPQLTCLGWWKVFQGAFSVGGRLVWIAEVVLLIGSFLLLEKKTMCDQCLCYLLKQRGRFAGA